jgi:hypothetical protein
MKYIATTVRTLALAVLLGTGLIAVSAPVAAAVTSVIGTVTHVSTTDVTVRTPTGETMKFLVVPKFKNLFSKDGKTTVQMSALKPGTPVTVYYNKVLGYPHASKILINGSTMQIKS